MDEITNAGAPPPGPAAEEADRRGLSSGKGLFAIPGAGAAGGSSTAAGGGADELADDDDESEEDAEAHALFAELADGLSEAQKHALLIEALDTVGPGLFADPRLAAARDAILFAAVRAEPALMRTVQLFLEVDDDAQLEGEGDEEGEDGEAGEEEGLAGGGDMGLGQAAGDGLLGGSAAGAAGAGDHGGFGL